jgi:centromeric protein E
MYYFSFLNNKDLEKQEELRTTHVHLKEHQETINRLRGIISEKTDEISHIQQDLDNANGTLKAQVYIYIYIFFFFICYLSNRV